jgi:hypothetical protein
MSEVMAKSAGEGGRGQLGARPDGGPYPGLPVPLWVTGYPAPGPAFWRRRHNAQVSAEALRKLWELCRSPAKNLAATRKP